MKKWPRTRLEAVLVVKAMILVVDVIKMEEVVFLYQKQMKIDPVLTPNLP